MKQTFSMLAILGFVFGATNAAASVEVSGFGDARYSINTSNTKATGFTFSEGAVYMKAGDDKAGVMVDLPFFGGQNNSSFSFASTRAQAYVHRKYDSGLWWKLGQFDGPYNYEKKDIIDINYTRQGSLSVLTPLTLTGAGIGTSFGSVGAALYITDAANTGLQNGNNFEYGLRFSGGAWSLGAHRFNNEDIMINGTYGMDMGKMGLNLDVIFNMANVGDSGFGALVDVWFEGDGMDWGIRPEFLSKLGGNNSKFGAAVGPRFKINDAFGVKFNYHFASTKQVAGGTSATTHNIDLAGQYRF